MANAPDSFQIATAFVKVRPDMDDFGDEVRQRIEDALSEPFRLRVSLDPAVDASRDELPPDVPTAPSGTATATPDGLAITIPPEMIRDGNQVIEQLGNVWREVFPGLEARCEAAQVGGFYPIAAIRFRVTPKDGQQ